MGHPPDEIETGDWFENLETDELFEVVAVDHANRTVEIQYFDGTVEEFEFEAWPHLPLMETAPPEDSSGAFDADREDLDADWVHTRGDLATEIDRLLY